jgi:hypothetical protein
MEWVTVESGIDFWIDKMYFSLGAEADQASYLIGNLSRKELAEA